MAGDDVFDLPQKYAPAYQLYLAVQTQWLTAARSDGLILKTGLNQVPAWQRLERSGLPADEQLALMDQLAEIEHGYLSQHYENLNNRSQ